MPSRRRKNNKILKNTRRNGTMIYDSIKNKDRYKFDPKLYEALCYLERVTEENFPESKVVLDGILKFVVPKVYDTEPVEDAPFEAHAIRADIHYMVVGTEGIQTADTESMKLKGEFSVPNDCGEYEGEPDGTYWIQPGYFAVAFPGEIHKTGIMKGTPEPIKKAVYKYQVND